MGDFKRWALFVSLWLGAASGLLPFRNASLPLADRLAWLVDNLSDQEKFGLLGTRTGPVERLGIRAYIYYVECNSGAYANGHYPSPERGVTCATENLTAFPQSPGMAASFNTTLETLKGQVIGRELRAIALAQLGDETRGIGLSCFSPMINIIRDPMWGRNSEAYSEDPYLTGRFAHAVISGMRSDAEGDGRFIRAFGGCKHYVPYDGAAVSHASDYDLFSTYLPGFARCIEAGALNLMCSYSTDGNTGSSADRGAGSASCINHRILTSLAKQTLQFPGFFISDEGAVRQPDSPAAFGAGCDTFLGSGSPSFDDVKKWLADGEIGSDRLDDAARRTLLPRFLLGEFDDPADNPFWDRAGGCGVVGAPAHRQLAYEAAAQSLVLLRNDGLLPLTSRSKVALVGPMTNATWMYNRYAYHPAPGSPLWVSVGEALAERIGGQLVTSTAGCVDANSTTACTAVDAGAVRAALQAADVAVFLVGTGEKIESEVVNHGIGATLSLPGEQSALMQLAVELKKPFVVVLFTTSPKNGPWMQAANAVISANYPQNGGAAAIAETLLGRLVPSGRLPMSWPKQWNCSIVPDPNNPGRTSGRCAIMPAKLLGTDLTYRCLGSARHRPARGARYGSSANTLFPFGFGLSYTNFSYSDLRAPSTIRACDWLNLSVTVRI